MGLIMTKQILKRIEYLLTAIEKGEYNPTEYAFTLILQNGNKKIEISDRNALISEAYIKI